MNFKIGVFGDFGEWHAVLVINVVISNVRTCMKQYDAIFVFCLILMY